MKQNGSKMNRVVSQLLSLMVCLTMSANGLAQTTEIKLRTGDVPCLTEVIHLNQIAEIRSTDPVLARRLGLLDIDAFENKRETIQVARKLVRMRILLAGLDADQFRITGASEVNVVQTRPVNIRELVETALQVQLADQFHMSPADLNIKLDPRFTPASTPELDFTTLSIDEPLKAELDLGRHNVSAVVLSKSGEPITLSVPVTVALMRQLVVARKNISKGQTLSQANIETVRRPVTSRNIQFASFEQAIGKQVQNDIQQYSLIKTNFVRSVPIKSQTAIKKNSLVNVVLRRGPLKFVLRDARALEKGNPGELIALMNSKTKEQILAKVVDSKTAEVQF